MKELMIVSIIALILSCAIGLSIENARLKKGIMESVRKNRSPYYKTDLSREEMVNALTRALNDSICLFLPADTSIMPYLVKRLRVINERKFLKGKGRRNFRAQ